MYGMVHLGLAEMVREQQDEETWNKITAAAGYPDLTIVSNQSYPDEQSFALVGAASHVLQRDAGELLEDFGRYWVSSFAAEQYRTLLDASGTDIPSFLGNLNNLHVRVGLIFPGYSPPRFEVSNIESRSLNLQYFSDRDGLTPFVVGLLKGIGDRFQENVEVDQIGTKGETVDHDVFRVCW